LTENGLVRSTSIKYEYNLQDRDRDIVRGILRRAGAALDPEFAFPIFARGTTDQAKTECYKLFTKFITDAELDKVFIFQDKDTVGGIT
jgi:hypothetical protein